MPVKVDIIPPPPANSKQPGVTKSLLYNGSKFQGHQKSKGNSYEVEVVLQVSNQNKVRNIVLIKITGFSWYSLTYTDIFII